MRIYNAKNIGFLTIYRFNDGQRFAFATFLIRNIFAEKCRCKISPSLFVFIAVDIIYLKVFEHLKSITSCQISMPKIHFIVPLPSAQEYIWHAHEVPTTMAFTASFDKYSNHQRQCPK